MASYLEKLVAKKLKETAKGGQKAIKPEQGKHRYRVLPGWRTEDKYEEGDKAIFWHDFSMHWIKTEPGKKPDAVYICNEKTFTKPCEICNALNHAIMHTDDDELRNHISNECMSKQRYLINVLHLTGTQPKIPQVMEVGPSVFNAILELDQEHKNITALEGGKDLIIKREGSGLSTTYNVMLAGESLKKVPSSVMESITDLDAFVDQTSDAKRMETLGKIAAMVGIEMAPSAKALSFDASEAVDAELEDWGDDELAEAEAEIEAKATPKPKARAKPKAEVEAEVEDDIDELDELEAQLLADLED